jgi:ubiquinone biosynthesis protein
MFLSRRNLGRMRQILLVAGRYGFGELIGRLPLPFRRPSCKECQESKDLPVWAKLRKLMEDLGPTTIKIGQVLSLRPDMVPVALSDELKKLQEDTPPEPFSTVMATLQKAYPGEEWPFDSVDEHCLASASLSQVHRAVKRQSKEELAVKVRRQGIEDLIEADLSIFRYLAEMAEEHLDALKSARLPDIVQEIRKTLMREIDFTNEARNMLLFNRFFESQELIAIPGVFQGLTREDVLVMDYMPGVRLDAYQGSQAERERLAKAGMEAVVQQMLVHGCFHADPHLGNLKVVSGRLCYYDWGMVGRLTPEMRSALVDYMLAVVNNDPDLVAQVALEMSVKIPPDLDRQRFVADVMFVLERIHGVPGQEVNLGRFVLDLTTLCRNYGVFLRSDYILMGRALLATEAAGRVLYPELDALEILRPVALEYMAKRQSLFFSDRPFWRTFKQRLDAAAGLPERAAKVLEQFERGEFRVRLIQEEQSKQLDNLRRSAYILSIGLITASLVIGSSLIVASDIGPHYRGLPVIGLAGFVLSGCLATWVVWKLLRRRG